MAGEWFFGMNQWLFFAANLGLLLLATEGGFRLGRRTKARTPEAAKSQVSSIQAAVLGLLALLLGFTFSMTLSRYDTRRELVLKEANAIGTAILRSGLLPKPHRMESARLLRQYVDVRLEFAQTRLVEQQKLRAVNDQTEQLHQQLWSHAIAVAEMDPRSVMAGLYVQALNDVIDLYSKRLMALESHVPVSILMLLSLVAYLAMGLTGYVCGLAGHRNFLVALTEVVLIAAVLLLIVDLDRPLQGLIQVSQQSMIDLHDSLKQISP